MSTTSRLNEYPEIDHDARRRVRHEARTEAARNARKSLMDFGTRVAPRDFTGSRVEWVEAGLHRWADVVTAEADHVCIVGHLVGNGGSVQPYHRIIRLDQVVSVSFSAEVL